jgi:uncharacterized repeat protein (TIGR01451 family)
MMVRRLAFAAMLVAVVTLVFAAMASAAAPRYNVKATWGDTNLTPGGEGQFTIQARNLGDATGNAPLTITDQLPPAATITAIAWPGTSTDLSSLCSGVGTSTLTCTMSASELGFYAAAPGVSIGTGALDLQPSGYLPKLFVDVAIDPAATGTQVNTATIAGGGSASPDSDVDQVPFGASPSAFGVVPDSFEADFFDAAFPFGSPVRQAGAHPFEFRVNFDLNQRTGVDSSAACSSCRYVTSNGLIKDAEVTLPQGMIGNPEALPKCDPVLFASEGALGNSTACPADTQVGYINIPFTSSTINRGSGQFLNPNSAAERVAIYNLAPPKGTPVDFGFNAGGLVQGHIYAKLDPAQNYAIKTVTPDISSLVTARGAQVTFWGVPADGAHDKFRYYSERQGKDIAAGAPWGSAPIRPFFTLPMDCGFENGGTRIRVDSYENSGQFSATQETANRLNVSGCDDPRFEFEPEIVLQPTDRHAGAPTGLDVHLTVPQRNDEVGKVEELYPEGESAGPKAIATPPIKKAVVTLPEGMTLNPSAAQGLGSCSLAQIGISPSGVPNDSPVSCPDSSQYGTLTLHTPILPADAPPKGFIYIAKQGDNPFHNFLSLYLVIEEPERGILVKIPGRVDLNAETGQITTTFEDLPQFPVSDIQMSFKSGVRAGLVQPQVCGEKEIRAEVFSWQEPSTAHVIDSSYDVTQRPDGSPCVRSLGERPFKPTVESGTTDNTAGRYAPFALRLTRSDDDQEFSQLGAKLPAGLTAKFAGVAICSDAEIARAQARTGTGEGVFEQAQPSCPGAAQIGTTEVGVGVGASLTWVPGKVYLAGPYRGAPLSMAAISPAVIGPFDVGVVAIRTALSIDPETAQGEAQADPFPQILHGIPVRIRDVHVNLNRTRFTLNPTSCAEKRIDARVTGVGGDLRSTADDTVANLFNRFQAAKCDRLGFKPKLTFRLFGGTHRRGFPRLKATVTYPKRGAYANIASAQVRLPSSELIENSHFNTICTRVQFAAKQCPAGSVYGHAMARTPLFDEPLKGPVYLRSSNHTLPDLVAVLRGPASQPVEVDLDGRVDSVKGGLRNTFEFVPDAPVERFTLTLLGGKKGLFVNSTDLCARTYRARARFTAQNGRRLIQRPALNPQCKASKKRHGGR